METLLPKLLLSAFLAFAITIHAAWSGGSILFCAGAFWISAQAIFLYVALWDLAIEALGGGGSTPGRDISS